VTDTCPFRIATNSVNSYQSLSFFPTNPTIHAREKEDVPTSPPVWCLSDGFLAVACVFHGWSVLRRVLWSSFSTLFFFRLPPAGRFSHGSAFHSLQQPCLPPKHSFLLVLRKTPPTSCHRHLGFWHFSSAGPCGLFRLSRCFNFLLPEILFPLSMSVFPELFLWEVPHYSTRNEIVNITRPSLSSFHWCFCPPISSLLACRAALTGTVFPRCLPVAAGQKPFPRPEVLLRCTG